MGTPRVVSRKSAGNVAKGAAKRLKKAGFGGVVIDYEAHGILAARGRVKASGARGKARDSKKDKGGRSPEERKRRTGSKTPGRREKRGRGGGARRDDDEESFLENEFF